MGSRFNDDERAQLRAADLASFASELLAEMAAAVATMQSLESTIANLAHENALLKRQLYGDKTERSRTDEA